MDINFWKIVLKIGKNGNQKIVRLNIQTNEDELLRKI